MIKSRLKKSKHAQVTIFIIIALIIVVLIAMVFLVWRKPTISFAPETDPQKYIESCTKTSVKEALDILSPRGGSINPENYKLYEEIPRRYLCYNENFYLACINQEPMLIEHIEKEITNYINPEIENCFSSFKEELEKKGYNIQIGEMNITTELKTRKVFVTIDRKIQLNKNQEERSFDNFKFQITHPIYDLANVAMEIINQESKYCNFEYIGHMIFYPRYNINKFVAGDSSKVYTVSEVVSGKEFVFAIKGCVVPPGF